MSEEGVVVIIAHVKTRDTERESGNAVDVEVVG